MSNENENNNVEIVDRLPLPTRPPTRNEHIATMLDPMAQVQLLKDAAKAQSQIVDWALKQTDSRHWDNMQGKPRLNKLGAHHVARLAGLNVRTFGSQCIETGEDAGGKFYVYQCHGEVSSPWSPSVISCQGTCDSRNKFHTTRYDWVQDKATGRKKKVRKELEAHEVNRAFIAQQAQTAAKVKGITEYLGLERLEWGDVERATQATEEDATAVEINDNRPDDRRPPRRDQAPPSEPVGDPLDQPADAEDRTGAWLAFCEAKGISKDKVTAETGAAFYAWVEAVLGGAKYRNKKAWTKGNVGALLKAAVKLGENEASAKGAEKEAADNGAQEG